MDQTFKDDSSGLGNKKGISVFVKFILAILLCESVGILSALLSNAGNNAWFDALNKPSWNPPPYLFAPVWTILYLMMGISLWLIWKNKVAEVNKRKQYFIFGIQLFLNFSWSIIFFRMHNPLLALMDIILMLALIIATTVSFARYSKPAAWLLVPYLAWVSFATFLNYSIWILNP
ncbi:MAG: tryptophan-rich sensory protein [Bacteroidetes bacterium]|nr:tryptophan-rich sensory protein [Bacteroidota bacterium]